MSCIFYDYIISNNFIDGDDTGAKVYGMENLMLIEFIICLIPVILAVFFFRDAPPTPPSHSTSLKIEVKQFIVYTFTVNSL